MTTDADATAEEKKAVGKRLRTLREVYGWTLDELSQRTKQIDADGGGVSKVSISRYENGDTFPGYREIKLLSQALATTVTHVFYGDNPDPYSPWDISLDEYLKNLIKDVLIEHRLIDGMSRRQIQQRKAEFLNAIEERRAPFDPPSTEEAIEKVRLKQTVQQAINELSGVPPPPEVKNK